MKSSGALCFRDDGTILQFVFCWVQWTLVPISGDDSIDRSSPGTSSNDWEQQNRLFAWWRKQPVLRNNVIQKNLTNVSKLMIRDWIATVAVINFRRSHISLPHLCDVIISLEYLTETETAAYLKRIGESSISDINGDSWLGHTNENNALSAIRVKQIVNNSENIHKLFKCKSPDEPIQLWIIRM
jgi:hypothetical protein